MRRARNGGAGEEPHAAAKTSKTLTPIPDKVAALKKSTGKKNPNFDSKAMNRKPAFQAVPRIEKRCVGGNGVLSGTRRVSEKFPHQKGDRRSIQGERFEGDVAGSGKVVAGEDVELKRRLEEKLGFLEEKVERIAFDIEQVKKMPCVDNSEVTLLEIEKKILGIEQEMGRVGSASEKEVVGGSYGNQVMDGVDGDGKLVNHEKNNKFTILNHEMLEMRLFPHQRLLRERTAKLKAKETENVEAGDVEEDRLGSHVSENQISEQSVSADYQVSVKSEDVGMESDGQGMDRGDSTELQDTSTASDGKHAVDIKLMTSETLDENDYQGNTQTMATDDDLDESSIDHQHQIGVKTSTGGWFVSDGELALLAHDDGCCSLYDVVNREEKFVYKPPVGVSTSIWRDCWLLRVAGVDGCLGKHVVAASAGNTEASGFCSWDFYSKTVHAFHLEDDLTPSRTLPGPSINSRRHIKDVLSVIPPTKNAKWWYKPYGPLMVSTASSQQTVKVFDVRDGEQIMKFQTQMPISTMDYSSPLQWRDREKVVLAESDKVSLWDVNSLNPKALLSAHSSNQKISALHIVNTEGEMSAGVRKRISQSEAAGNDGVFCTADFISLLDFRHPSGFGLKTPMTGVDAKSLFCHGDTVLVGGSSGNQNSPLVQQFSLRKQRLVTTYPMPEYNNTHSNMVAITQVWGDSNLVMGMSSLGLTIYDAPKDSYIKFWGSNYNDAPRRFVIGPNDMYAPSFDYALSRILLISRDRPAMWRHLV